MSVEEITADVHDSKGAVPLISNLLSEYLQVKTIEGDLGYRGAFNDYPMDGFDIKIDLVKSNYGISKFILHSGIYASGAIVVYENEPYF